MSKYQASIQWHRQPEEAFTDKRYSRAHVWSFDGGIEVPASSSPQVVPLPYSAETHVDPEEAFVASLSSCHMLFFLSEAAQAGYVVDRYIDDAEGVMAKNSDGKIAMTEVCLRPKADFPKDNMPAAEEIENWHHKAHEQCFIANSVTTEIKIEIQ